MKLDDILKDEVDRLKSTLEGQINDPAQKAAIAAMVNDLAMLPIRMARGEDVSVQLASLKAEAAVRGFSAVLKAQAATQQAWMNIITKIIGAALVAL